MKRLLLIVFCCLTTGLVIGQKAVYPQQEIIYGRKDGMVLTLVWLKPTIQANGKAILYVNSSSWKSSYNGAGMETRTTEQYLARGYSVFCVMHGSAPRYAIPDAVSDIKRSVRFVRFNASRFGINPSLIGITGGSAGGHLSLVVAMATDTINTSTPDSVDRVSSRVQAAAVLFPPTDLLNWDGRGRNMVNAKEPLKVRKAEGPLAFTVWNAEQAIYEAVTDSSVRNRIGREISPVYFISPDDPPVLIIHGDADSTVPVQQSQAFAKRLTEAGVPNRLIIKKGGTHSTSSLKPEWQQFVDWFDKYLK
jgi:acetyl esterase/lipase